MNQKPLIATLVISSSTYPAVRNMKMQKKIYLNEKKKDRNIFWYRQGTIEQLQGKKYNLIGNDLYLDVSDDTLNMGRKTLLAFEWLNKNIDYDYVVRPTPSSYIHYENLKKYIIDNFYGKEIVYGGKVQETNDKLGNKIEFASGSSLVLNKRCVDIILENENLWDHDYWDDVGLAMLLKKVNIKPTGGERFDVKGNPYKQEIDSSHYQYRCRSDNHYGYPRIIESHVLNAVHRITTGNKPNNLIVKLNFFLLEIFKFFYIYQFGWKVFSATRAILKFILPLSLFKLLKSLLKDKITSFKLKRFKT